MIPNGHSSSHKNDLLDDEGSNTKESLSLLAKGFPFNLRRKGDSNPRYVAVHYLSKVAP